jgi:hypothetical protein
MPPVMRVFRSTLSRRPAIVMPALFTSIRAPAARLKIRSATSSRPPVAAGPRAVYRPGSRSEPDVRNPPTIQIEHRQRFQNVVQLPQRKLNRQFLIPTNAPKPPSVVRLAVKEKGRNQGAKQQPQQAESRKNNGTRFQS